jgi:hypothetical protein
MGTACTTEAVVRQALDLAQALPPEQRTATLGAVLALTYPEIAPHLAERLQEDPMLIASMTSSHPPACPLLHWGRQSRGNHRQHHVRRVGLCV